MLRKIPASGMDSEVITEVQVWSLLCVWLNLPKEKEKVKDRAQEKPVCGRLYYCSANIHPLSMGGACFPAPLMLGLA